MHKVFCLLFSVAAMNVAAGDHPDTTDEIFRPLDQETLARRDVLLAQSMARREQLARRFRQADEAEPSLPGTGTLETPSHLERRALDIDGTTREYFLYAPINGNRPMPVVFALHGGAANSGLQMHFKADYTELGEREGFAVVYPSGYPRGWNWSSDDGRPNDFDFFNAMFDQLIEAGIADPARIYMTGGSNGGHMTYALAHKLGDRIAAAGVMVSVMPRSMVDWTSPARPVPIVIALGTLDPLMPFDGNKTSLSAVQTISYWCDVNRCAGSTGPRMRPDLDPDDGTTVMSQTWTGAAPVMLYRMEGHGHGWPQVPENASGPKTRDVQAPSLFWSFLSDHSLGRSR